MASSPDSRFEVWINRLIQIKDVLKINDDDKHGC